MSFNPNPYGQLSTSEMYGSNPPTPHPQQQQQDPPGAFPQWETLEQPQEYQQTHSPLDTTPVPTPTSTSFHTMHLDLEDPPHMVPSHHSPIDDTPILLHHPNEFTHPHQHQHHGGQPTNEPLLFHPAGSAPPTPGPSGTSASSIKPSGVVRSSTSSRGRATTTHPYYRPAVSGGTPFGMAAGVAGQSPASSSGSSSRTAQPRKQSVRFSGTTAHGGMVPRPTTRSTTAAMPMPMPSPAVPSPTSRLGFLAGSTTNSPQTQQHHSFSPQDSAHTHTPQTPQAHQFPGPSHAQSQAQSQGSPPQTTVPASRPRRVQQHIPSDMHYDDRENTLTASLELPGVTQDNLRVTLGTCYFNHVKYVGITAESTPPFPPPEWPAELIQAVRAELERGLAGALADGKKMGKVVNPNLRERRFGIMRRVIQVPGHTKMNDITASLRDGVLTLRIYCGKPFELDDEQEVPVRLG